MAITNYSELKAAVANWLHRSDLATNIPDFIALAEDYINRELRERRMEATATGTISAESTALPSDFRAARKLSINYGGLDHPLTPVSFEELDNTSSSGVPVMFAISGSNFVVGPSPSSSYAYTLTYYQTVPSLSDSNTTNWLLTNAKDVYLYAALSESAPFLKADPRLGMWMKLRDERLDALQKQNASAAGGMMRIRGDVCH